MTDRSSLVIALIGNPNTGKSTLFTALAGVRQRVGNYPGVTVEKKIGAAACSAGRDCQLVDLPGTYSLAPRSPDEMVAVDVLLGRQADVGRDRRRAVDRRRQQPGAQSVPGQPGARAGPADGGRAEHDRRRPRQGTDDRRRPAAPSSWACRSSKCRPIGGSASPSWKRAAGRGRRSARRQRRARARFPPRFSSEVGRLAGRWSLEPRSLRFASCPATWSSGCCWTPAAICKDTLVATARADAVAAEVAARSRVGWPPGCPVPAIEAQARYAWVARVLEGVVTASGAARRDAGRSASIAC